MTILTTEAVVCTDVLITGEMRHRLRWADGKLVKEAIDQQLEALLGPRGGPATSPHKNKEEVSNSRLCMKHDTKTA